MVKNTKSYKNRKNEFKNAAILTSRKSWFAPYAKKFAEILNKKGYKSQIFYNHKKIASDFGVVFVLSYFSIIKNKYLRKHKHNLVVHESDLPKGKGWAPLFWQILEGKSNVPIVLFEATPNVDRGSVYIKDYIRFNGGELNSEIRQKQASKTIELCLRFLNEHSVLKAMKQHGHSTFYKKRTPIDSELNINKSLRNQFNLLRIVNNDEFPAFLKYKGKRYILKIFRRK